MSNKHSSRIRPSQLHLGNKKAIVLLNFYFSTFQLLLLLLHTTPIFLGIFKKKKRRLGCVKIQITQLSSGALENYCCKSEQRELIYHNSHRAKSTSHAIKRAKLKVIFGINFKNCDFIWHFPDSLFFLSMAVSDSDKTK